MISICLADFSNVCRICLLFGDLGPFKDSDYKVFQSITPADIPIELEDQLPKNICRNCIKDLENVSEFISKCRNSNNILKSIITQKSNEDAREEKKDIHGNTSNVTDISEDFCAKIEIDNNFTGTLKEELKVEVEAVSIFDKNNLSKGSNENLDFCFTCTNAEEPSFKCRDCKKLSPDLIVHDVTECIQPIQNVQERGFSTHKKKRIFEKAFVKAKFHENDKETKGKVCLCKICGKNYGSVSKLKAHINVHIGIKPFKCELCGKQFTHRNSWRYHVSTHMYEKLFKCIFCSWRGVNKISFDTHIQKFHKQSEVLENAEDKCNIKINTDAEKRNHIFLCNICGKNFTRKSTLNVHFKIHKGEKNFECDICGLKFILKCTLNRHLAVHEDKKEFTCNICGKGLSQKRYLKKHIDVFHGTEKGALQKKDKIPSYFCLVCGRGFIFRKLLKHHESVHKTGGDKNNKNHNKNEAKDFLCTECGKQFAFKQNLNRHILTTHCGEKPFECNICGDKFTAKTSLDCHLNIHNSIKPYQCESCQKSFRQRSTLRKHILVHTGERRFKCHICEMAFKTSSHLKTHFKRHNRS